MRAWSVSLLLVVACLGVPALGHAQSNVAAKTFGPFTLNSVNYAPDTTGIPISDYDDHCTVQLILASGTISVNVEASLTGGGGFVNTGALSASTLTSLEGPLDYARFNVTACSSCLATATIRCRASK
jgi:hypothetical protein